MIVEQINFCCGIFPLIKYWWLYNAEKNVLGFWQLLHSQWRGKPAQKKSLRKTRTTDGTPKPNNDLSEAPEPWWYIPQLDIIKLGDPWCIGLTIKMMLFLSYRPLYDWSRPNHKLNKVVGSIWGFGGRKPPWACCSMFVTTASQNPSISIPHRATVTLPVLSISPKNAKWKKKLLLRVNIR